MNFFSNQINEILLYLILLNDTKFSIQGINEPFKWFKACRRVEILVLNTKNTPKNLKTTIFVIHLTTFSVHLFRICLFSRKLGIWTLWYTVQFKTIILTHKISSMRVRETYKTAHSLSVESTVKWMKYCRIDLKRQLIKQWFLLMEFKISVM